MSEIWKPNNLEEKTFLQSSKMTPSCKILTKKTCPCDQNLFKNPPFQPLKFKVSLGLVLCNVDNTAIMFFVCSFHELGMDMYSFIH